MTDTCPAPDGLDEQARLALSLLFQQVSDATASAAVQLWAHSVEDVVLGYDEPQAPLDVLSTPELCAVHPILVAALSACDDRPYRQWLIDLGRMITERLDERTAEQMLINAQAAAIDAEETRRAREGRRPEDLRGLPKWSELSGPKPDQYGDVRMTPRQGFRRVVSVVLTAMRRMLAAARRCLVSYRAAREAGRFGKP
jgi:hypothetical protein